MTPKEKLHDALLARMQKSMPEKTVKDILDKYGHPIAFKTVYTEKILKINEAERSFPAIASTASQDRIGDVLHSDGWDMKDFTPNPVMLWAHDYRGLPIGKVVNPHTDGDKLKFTASFVPADIYAFADTVYKMFKGGWLNAFSVGFDPLEWVFNEENGGMEFFKQALLEVSAVPVPMNAEALAERTVQEYIGKGFGIKICTSCKGAQPPAPPAVVPAPAPAAAAKIGPDSIIISPFEFKNMEDMIATMAIIKSGKVISDANRASLEACIDQMKKAIEGVAGILQLTEAPKAQPASKAAMDIDAALDEARKLLAR